MWVVTVEDDKKLVMIKSGKSLDFFNIQNILRHIYLENEGRYSSYNRFIDLSNLGDVDTNYDSIRDQVQLYRQINPLEDSVKIATYIPFGTLRAIFQIYIEESEFSDNRYMVSDSLDRCAEYLSVDKAVFQP